MTPHQIYLGFYTDDNYIIVLLVIKIILFVRRCAGSVNCENLQCLCYSIVYTCSCMLIFH